MQLALLWFLVPIFLWFARSPPRPWNRHFCGQPLPREHTSRDVAYSKADMCLSCRPIPGHLKRGGVWSSSLGENHGHHVSISIYCRCPGGFVQFFPPRCSCKPARRVAKSRHRPSASAVRRPSQDHPGMQMHNSQC